MQKSFTKNLGSINLAYINSNVLSTFEEVGNFRSLNKIHYPSVCFADFYIMQNCEMSVEKMHGSTKIQKFDSSIKCECLPMPPYLFQDHLCLQFLILPRSCLFTVLSIHSQTIFAFDTQTSAFFSNKIFISQLKIQADEV